jgi:protein TonB
MRQRESVPGPRGWTREAAWKGAGASLLLHLIVGAAAIGAFTGPPNAPPRVIDLTLLSPAEIDRRPVPLAFAAAKPAWNSGSAVLPEPPPLPAPATVANPPDGTAPATVANPPDGTAPATVTNPPDGTAPATPPDPAGGGNAPAAGSPHGAPYAVAVPVPTGQGHVNAAAGSPAGTPGAGSAAGDFAWIRDAIQRAIAYPPSARKMGWEGQVVVAFKLLSDGSVRDVRVVQGSGHAALDRGAVDAVRGASPFPRSPFEAEVITPVVYRLTKR